MRIMVSACLLGQNCKYNGKNNLNMNLIKYLKSYNVIPICPEVQGGLSTPRIPSERCFKQVITKDGRDVTEQFQRGAMIALQLAKQENCAVAILKKYSPSCGFGEIYDGTFSSRLKTGNGVTAELLYQNGIVVLNEENYTNLDVVKLLKR
ncbi:MAG: DUF523 domain-containing protein [Prevotella sp.]|nr:DUF523 domain-containing protein [Staphylococcus sp.]MCM1349835.1 DUF523 domain-containing protein [Prevotella sp.]